MKRLRQQQNAGAARKGVRLRILETTDLHVHLHPYDYSAEQQDAERGLAQLATLIDQARAEEVNTLLFDNGDFLQGTPVGDFIAYDMDLRDGMPHPVIAAMNALEYDAITLGNHEFNYGLEFLEKALAQADCPVVSANILRATGAEPLQDRHMVAPYTMLDRDLCDAHGQTHPIRIGVIGLAPPQITLWERQHLRGRIRTRDMVEAACAWVPELRAKGADLVVLLAHSGIGPDEPAENMENALIPLAQASGVDVILGGHSHQLFPSNAFGEHPDIDIARGTICEVPAVISGCFGTHLGVVDLTLERNEDGWQVSDARSALRAVSDHFEQRVVPKPDPAARPFPARHCSPAVRRIVAQTHAKVLDSLRQPIGATSAPINSFFVYLGQSAATALVAQAQERFVREHLAAPFPADLPVISAVSPSKAGGLGGAQNFTDIEPGALTLRSLADLYVFPNSVAALRLTGAHLLLWLERSVSAYHRLRPGQGRQPLMNPAFPGYNFEILYGLEYEIDLSAPPRFGPDGAVLDHRASRIRNPRWSGAPLDPAAEFIVCTNSFRAFGAGGFAGTGGETLTLTQPAIIRDALRAYVVRDRVVDVASRAPFRLLPMGQTTATLRTSPNATAHLHLIEEFAPRHLGRDSCGFTLLGITL